MRTGENFLSAASYPDDEYAKQGWVQLERDFSLGQASPTQIAIDGPADAPQVKAAVARLRAALAEDERYGPSTVQTSESNDLTVVSTAFAGDPGDDDAQQAVKRLRSGAVASAFGNVRDGNGTGGPRVRDRQHRDGRRRPRVLRHLAAARHRSGPHA